MGENRERINLVINGKEVVREVTKIKVLRCRVAKDKPVAFVMVRDPEGKARGRILLHCRNFLECRRHCSFVPEPLAYRRSHQRRQAAARL